MNIENNLTNAKKSLRLARNKVATHEYDTALDALAIAYSHIRKAMDQVLEMKRESERAARPAGDNTG
jgi:hypothetical protein